MELTEEQIEELVLQGHFDELEKHMRQALDEALLEKGAVPDPQLVAMKAQLALAQQVLEAEGASHQEAIAVSAELDDLLQYAGEQDLLAQARATLQ